MGQRRRTAKAVTGNGAEDRVNNGRQHTVAKSKTTRRSTGTIATPILMDTLRAGIDNLIAAGFGVRAGNLHGGLVLQVQGVLRCEACGAFVPAEYWQSDGCVNCRPTVEVASTGTREETA